MGRDLGVERGPFPDQLFKENGPFWPSGATRQCFPAVVCPKNLPICRSSKMIKIHRLVFPRSAYRKLTNADTDL